MNKPGLIMEGRVEKGKERGGRVEDSMGKEQAICSVYHRPGVAHSRVPIPNTAPGTR